MAKALLTGHSFIRRFRDDKLSRFRGPDVDSSAPFAAQLLARRMGFDDGRFCSHVFTFANKVNLIEDLHGPAAKKELEAIKPRLVVINIGSNNLAQLKTVDERAAEILAKQTHDKATEIINEHESVRAVVVFSVVPRNDNDEDGRLKCSEDTFRANMDKFNSKLKSLCKPKNGLHFERMRGFACLDVSGKPRPTESWSDDNLHFRVAPPGTNTISPMHTYGLRLYHAMRHRLHDC